MAILKDLIVSGSSRLLGKLYTNDIEIGNDLTVTGVTTTTRMIISSTNNPNTLSSTNSSTGNIPLIIGSPTGRHIAIDADEIAAKKNSTTGDSLFLNYGGGNVYLSTGYTVFASGNEFTATTYKGSHLGNTEAYFASGYITTARITTANTNTINNTDMITTSALDVKGKLHAVEYDLENIMDLGGSFVVAPTLIVPSSGSGTKTLTVSKSNNTTVVLTVKDPSITSTGIAGFAWANNYKVKVSGLINNTVLGTCDGYINSTNVGSNTISLTVTMDSATVTAIATTVSNYKLNIMLYNTDTSSATAVTKPLGIYLQHYQLTNNPIINVWNGQTTTPKVRIGYLGGITYNGSSLGTNAQNSWGLYSDNVFLEGQIVAKGGKIGGYSIGTSNLTKGTTQDASGSFWLTPEGQSATMSHLSSSAQTWAMTVGQDFGVTTSGSIYAHAGYIAGWKIENNDLVTGTWGSDNSAMLCTGTTGAAGSKEIGGSSSISGWVFTAGSKFGVTKGGALYCTDIHATGGSISGSLVSTGISASNITTGTLSAERIAVTDFTNYCQLNPNTATLYGWTLTQDSSNPNTPWYVRDTLGRDNYPSTWFDCKPGDIFKVSMTASSTVTGATTNGGAGGTYMNINLGVQCQTATGSSSWPTFTIVTSSAAGTETTKIGYVTIPTSAEYIKFRAFIQIGGVAPFAGTLKIRNPVIKRVGADEYITYINSTDGIKIHNSNDDTDYLQINSTAIKMYRNNTQKMYLDDSKLQFTNGSTLLSQLDSTSQKFYDGSGNVVASFGSDGIKMYLKGTTTETVNINNSGATFKGAINATSGFIGQNTTNGFNITTNAIYNGISSIGATSGTGIFLGKEGINLGGGKFKVTNAGAVTATNITATGGYIGSYEIGTQYLQATDGTTGMSIKDDSYTKDWAFWAGGATKETAKFRVTHDGDLYTTSLFVDIGGKNLIPLSANLKSFIIENSSRSTVTWTDTNVTIINTFESNSTYGIYYQWIPVEPNTKYTLSFTSTSIVGTARSSGGFRKSDGTTIGSSLWTHDNLQYLQVTSGRNVRTFTTPAEAAEMRIYMSVSNTNAKQVISNIKLEKGIVATDWSSAPEDLDVHKYVTEIDSNGIWVTPSGKKPTNATTVSSVTGTRINADGMQIFKDGTQVASYGSSIVIGKENGSHVRIINDGIRFSKVTNIVSIKSEFIEGPDYSGDSTDDNDYERGRLEVITNRIHVDGDDYELKKTIITGEYVSTDGWIGCNRLDCTKINSSDIKCGVTQLNSCNANAMRNTTITFTTAFPSTGGIPCVVACFAGDMSSVNFAHVQLSIVERTHSGFTVRMHNATDATRQPWICWFATTSSLQ